MSVPQLKTPEPERILVPMLTITRAIDLYLGAIANRGYSRRTEDSYRRLLDKFADSLPPDTDVTEITEDHVLTFLAHWRHRTPGTRAHLFSVMSSFCKWLTFNRKVKRNPMEYLERPKRTPPENLDTKSVSAVDVRALLDEARPWTEKLAVAIPAYLGARRRAVALLRMKDYDRKRQRMRFQEKGGKVIWKPVPTELATLLDEAIEAGAIKERDDYLVPPYPEGSLTTGRRDRDDRIIWRAVTDVCKRVGVEGHVHALRAAFAVFYLENHPNDIAGLQQLMGHRSIATTNVYLRHLDRSKAMDRVKTLSWATTPEEEA
jgi:integrase